MSRKPQALAAITIGFDSYILPLAKAAQVVELMAQAVPVKRDYGVHREQWTMTMGPCQLRIDTVQADQIVTPGAPLSLTHRRGA